MASENVKVLDIIRKEKEMSWFDKQLGDVTKGSAAKQLTVGGITGCLGGLLFTKVGKTAASALAGSLFIFQIAQHQGYIKINWPRLNKDIEKAKRKLDKHSRNQLQQIFHEGQQFVQENKFLATGFAGGFLLGISLS